MSDEFERVWRVWNGEALPSCGGGLGLVPGGFMSFMGDAVRV